MKATPGVLVECDPAIKAIILKIDEQRHDFVIEDLDDTHLVVNAQQLDELKKRLEEVSCPLPLCESAPEEA